MATSAIDTIKKYLDDRAKSEAKFAISYAKENKNIKDCYAYIISEARKQAASAGVCCMTDDEVFGLAVHYYDEDDLDMSGAKKERKSTDVKVVKSESSETPEIRSEQKPKPAKKTSAKKTKAKKEPKPERKFVQLSLFDFD